MAVAALARVNGTIVNEMILNLSRAFGRVCATVISRRVGAPNRRER